MTSVRVGGGVVTLVVCAGAAWGQAPAQPNLGANQWNAPLSGEVQNRQNMAVVVHGWTSNPDIWVRDTNASWGPLGFQNTLRGALGAASNQWDVWGFDWREGASDRGTTYPATSNEINAQRQGQYLAKQILAQSNAGHVHLFGHSLGGRVVETAATIIRQANPNITIHQTFLDAYTPYAWSRVYGEHATYADHIVNMDGAGSTNDMMPHAHNVDVTAMQPAIAADWFPEYSQRTTSWAHNWPHFAYKQQMQSPGDDLTFSNHGFQQSKEHLGNGWLNSPRTTGDRATITGVGHWTQTPVPQVGVQPASAFGVTPNANGTVVEQGGEVTLTGTDIVMRTEPDGQAAWAKIRLLTAAPINYIQFDYKFTQLYQNGFVSVRLDDHLLWAADEVNSLDRFLSSGKLMWTGTFFGNPTDDALAAGEHFLSFRLDQTASLESLITIRAITGGLIAVPEPAAVLALLGLAVVRRRRA
jgi:pimeloyl-ACP methyl ester carboxylesterase